MAKMFGALFLAASVAYAGAASADTIVYYAETDGSGVRQDVDVTLASPGTWDISIDYDSSSWASINSAFLTVMLGDDAVDVEEFADVKLLEGEQQIGDVVRVEGKQTREYWHIDVSDKLLPPDHYSPLTFTLQAIWRDFDYRNAKLTVDLNFIPVPEPATTALLGSGLLVAGLALRRRVS